LSIEDLGNWPVPGPEGRKKHKIMRITEDGMLRVIHGKENRIPFTFFVSNDLVHMGKFRILTGRWSELEEHEGDEAGFVVKGTLRISLTETMGTLEVEEGERYFIPSGMKHQYFNLSDRTVEAIFAVAPKL